MAAVSSRRTPWSFVPSLYFAEAVPFVIVNSLSVALYKSLGAGNEFIGCTSLLYLPWTLKLFWSPLVDATGTKRGWSIAMQSAIAACLAGLALAVAGPFFIAISLAVFVLMAILSASNDIATDGFYLHALEHGEQAFFTGIRSTFYRLATLFSGGILLMVAGGFGTQPAELAAGWRAALWTGGGVMLTAAAWHAWTLPRPPTDGAVRSSAGRVPYGEIFRTYFARPGLAAVLAYILLYRFGEGLLLKMVQPFLLDARARGGMACTVREVGIMYGTLGVGALMIGGILGGWLIKRQGLRRWILPMALCMNLPNLFFLYLAHGQPAATLGFQLFGWTWQINPLVQLVLLVEQFGYGVGFAAFMVYLVYSAAGPYRTSHFAISTGLMAVGMMVPGLLSGWIQAQVGYFWLFAISLGLGGLGMIPIFFLPPAGGEAAHV